MLKFTQWTDTEEKPLYVKLYIRSATPSDPKTAW